MTYTEHTIYHSI